MYLTLLSETVNNTKFPRSCRIRRKETLYAKHMKHIFYQNLYGNQFLNVKIYDTFRAVSTHM